MGLEFTGASAFGFGVDWQRTEGDRAIARQVITFLEDRRLLFGARHIEDEAHCVQSALQIRALMTDQITRAKPGNELETCLRAMRAACRRFVEAGGPEGRNFVERYGAGVDVFSLALGDMRTAVGVQVGLITTAFDLPLEPELASIIPPGDDDGQDLTWIPGFG